MSTLRVDTILGESGAERRGLMTYAIICDQKAQNTDGGTFTAGAWQKRNLNTTIADPDSIVTIANDQFTLQAGSYFIEARSPAYGVDSHRIRLYNATDSSEVQLGPSSYSREATSDLGYDDAHLFARVTITSATAFEIQHRSMTDRSNNGFGVPTNFGAEIYTTVKIFKEA